ncbi:hypothetical protein [Micromonospora sp. NPDC005205]|uniref:hypothetical protein n=1 Tax=Micromonospora sp. NPDC005205 TaxID=3156714 RepID=UPI0033A62B14
MAGEQPPQTNEGVPRRESAPTSEGAPGDAAVSGAFPRFDQDDLRSGAEQAGFPLTDASGAGTQDQHRSAWTGIRRALSSAPGMIAVVAGLVGIIAGLAGLVPAIAPLIPDRTKPTQTPEEARPNPFEKAVFTEPFTSANRDPVDVRKRFAMWLDAATDGSDDDVWTTEVDTAAGLFRLSNQADPNAVRYRWLSATNGGDLVPVNLTNRPIAVDVRLSKRLLSTSAAGLMYRWSDKPKTYYAFLLSGDGTYSFVARSDGLGFSYRLTERSERIIPDGWNTLAIAGRDDQLDLYINGALVKTVDATDFPYGNIGVIAASTGVFEFDNFRIFE